MKTGIKKVWRKPEVKTMTAGSAEQNPGCGNDGNGLGSNNCGPSERQDQSGGS